MDSLIALVPTIGVLAIFAFVLRNIVRADSKERAAIRRLERELDDAEA